MTDGAEIVATEERSEPSRSLLMTLFVAAVVASLVLPRLPYGRNALYPFALLGVWAHELGHGLVGLLVGGSFERLEVYSNLGGVAFIGGVGADSFGQVLVSMGGLLGPAIAGGLVIVYGSKPKTARWVLAGLAIAVGLSVLLFVRNGFGAIALSLIAAVLAVLGFKGPELVRLGIAQLVGVQLCLTSWGSLNYMFTRDFVRDGRTVDSDTQNIADVLFLPYWFWGGLVAALSFAILGYSFYRAWIRPARLAAAEEKATPTLDLGDL